MKVLFLGLLPLFFQIPHIRYGDMVAWYYLVNEPQDVVVYGEGVIYVAVRDVSAVVLYYPEKIEVYIQPYKDPLIDRFGIASIYLESGELLRIEARREKSWDWATLQIIAR